VELDERLTLASAEGIDLDLTLAGIGSRGVAFLVDLAIQALALFAVAAVGSASGGLGAAFYALATFLVLLGYPILAEAFASGRTIGKALLKISVIATDGTPITFLASVIRNVVRFVDALPGTYFVGLAAILVTRRNQRVGDLAAGTLVVHRASTGTVPDGADLRWGLTIDPVLSPEAAGWDVAAVTAAEVAAARSFLVRRGDLDPTHRADLAQTLAFQLLPKVAGVPLEGGPELFLERVVSAKSNR
jgi:uncharacterized RDD family membrane protein YckC